MLEFFGLGLAVLVLVGLGWLIVDVRRHGPGSEFQKPIQQDYVTDWAMSPAAQAKGHTLTGGLRPDSALPIAYESIADRFPNASKSHPNQPKSNPKGNYKPTD